MPLAPSLPPRRASLWEWVQTALLAVNLVWTTLYMGGYRPVAQLVTLGLTTALLLVHGAMQLFAREAGGIGEGEARSLRAHPAGWWLLPFLIYAAANVLWVAPAQWLGWLDWLNWAQMIAVFWVVLNGIRAGVTRRWLVGVLLALGVVGVVLGCYQRFVRPDWVMVGQERAAQFIGRASGSFSIPNSLAAWLILLLPPLLALVMRRRATEMQRVWWGWLAAVFLFGLVMTLSRGGWLALLLGLAVWPLSRRRWSWKRRVLVALAVIGIASAVGTWTYRVSPQARTRLVALVRDAGERTRPIMWRGAWALFREEPVFGTGAGSYNNAFEKHRPEQFPDKPLWVHNEYLNTLSDYGAVGFALIFGAAAAIAVRCVLTRRDDAASREGWIDSGLLTAGFGVGLLAFSLQMFVDFHLKIPALALAFATVSGLAVQNRWTLRNAEGAGVRRAFSNRFWNVRRWTGVTVIVALGIAVVFFFVPLLRSEMLRVPARRAIDRLGAEEFSLDRYRAMLPVAQRALTRATEIFPRNGQAWADLAYVTALLPFLEPERTNAFGVDAERAAERALACAPTHAEFWIRRGAARDLQGRWQDAGGDFARATELAPASATTWYYYGDHLSRLPAAQEAAEAALAFCLRLDPGNTPALALRQRLALNSGPR